MKPKFNLFLLLFVISSFLLSCQSTKSPLGNMVAKMQVDEPIEGVCNNDAVYVLFSAFGDGQIPSKCSLSDEEINTKVNAEVTFLTENPGHSDEGMMGLIINCKGEVVKCEINNKTQSEELDKQIEAAFRQLTNWQVGTLHGNPVDNSVLMSFKIKNGVFILN